MGYFPHRIAAVISLMEVSDPFGGTLGLTIMTTVFNNVADLGSEENRDFAALGHADPAELSAATEKARAGIAWAFVAIFPFMVLVSLGDIVPLCHGPLTDGSAFSV
jgi:hypothetical protein